MNLDHHLTENREQIVLIAQLRRAAYERGVVNAQLEMLKHQKATGEPGVLMDPDLLLTKCLANLDMSSIAS